MGKTSTDPKKIALLLDCDDRMAEAFAKEGYKVERGTTGFVDAKRRLPRPLYEADVIVYDMQNPTRFDAYALRKASKEAAHPFDVHWRDFIVDVEKVGDPWEWPEWDEDYCLLVPRGAIDEPPDIDDETPELSLRDVWSAMSSGALVICFLNRRTLPVRHARELYAWLAPRWATFRFSMTKDSPERCKIREGGPWAEFFKEVLSPLMMAVSVSVHEEAYREYDYGDCYLDDLAPLLANRKGESHAFMARYGSGALFMLPEFRDNAAAAVLLATEIWPKLREEGTARPIRTGREEEATAKRGLPHSFAGGIGERPARGPDYEHPREVLERFREHVSQRPKEDSEEWKARFFELLWRWGEAVIKHPDLRERFLDLAGAIGGPDATKLFDSVVCDLRNMAEIVRDRCNDADTLDDQPDFDGSDLPGPVRRNAPNGRDPGTDSWPRLPTSECVSFLLGRLRGASLGWSDAEDDCPALVSKSIDWACAASYALRCLLASVPEERRSGGEFERLMELQGRVRQSVRRLRRLFVEGRGAELWRAAFNLLHSYLVYCPTPEPVFDIWALPILDPDAREMLRSPFGSYGRGSFWGSAPRRAGAALDAMELMTRWLREREKQSGADAPGEQAPEAKAAANKGTGQDARTGAGPHRADAVAPTPEARPTEEPPPPRKDERKVEGPAECDGIDMLGTIGAGKPRTPDTDPNFVWQYQAEIDYQFAQSTLSKRARRAPGHPLYLRSWTYGRRRFFSRNDLIRLRDQLPPGKP